MRDFLYLCWSPDSKNIALSNRNDQIYMLSLKTAKGENCLRLGSSKNMTTEVNQMVYSPNGESLWVASGGNPGKLQIFSSKSLQHPEQSVPGHNWTAISLACDPTGKYICSGGADGLITVWEPHQPMCLRCFLHPGQVITNVDFNYTGSLIAWGTGAGLQLNMADQRIVGRISLHWNDKRDQEVLRIIKEHGRLSSGRSCAGNQGGRNFRCAGQHADGQADCQGKRPEERVGEAMKAWEQANSRGEDQAAERQDCPVHQTALAMAPKGPVPRPSRPLSTRAAPEKEELDSEDSRSEAASDCPLKRMVRFGGVAFSSYSRRWSFLWKMVQAARRRLRKSIKEEGSSDDELDTGRSLGKSYVYKPQQTFILRRAQQDVKERGLGTSHSDVDQVLESWVHLELRDARTLLWAHERISARLGRCDWGSKDGRHGEHGRPVASAADPRNGLDSLESTPLGVEDEQGTWVISGNRRLRTWALEGEVLARFLVHSHGKEVLFAKYASTRTGDWPGSCRSIPSPCNTRGRAQRSPWHVIPQEPHQPMCLRCLLHPGHVMTTVDFNYMGSLIAWGTGAGERSLTLMGAKTAIPWHSSKNACAHGLNSGQMSEDRSHRDLRGCSKDTQLDNFSRLRLHQILPAS
ncbi:unnamed protein product [Effrenium voratum]|nr:unnamed protein product [Effrenium voratum]